MSIVNLQLSSFFELINSNLKHLNFFEKSVELTFEKQKNFKTYIGGLTSLIIYSLILVFAIKEGLNLVERKDPNITETETYHPGAPLINITNNQFFAAYFMDKEDNIINDPSYFTIEMNQLTKTKLKDNSKGEKKLSG